MARASVKVYAVVFTPACADHPAERQIVLFGSRESAERAQSAMVDGSGGFTIAGETYFCKSNQGVYVEERTVF